MQPILPFAPDLPKDRYGFRLRGAAATRLEAFVDAAFAFAVTLLVIGGTELPTSLAELRNAMKDIPAFAGSFAVIAQIWWSHYGYSQRYGLEDGRTTFYSLLLVFLVLVYVYPLKLMFTSLFAWISGGWLLNRPIDFGGMDDLRAMFVIYGMAWAVLSLVFLGMLRHALRRADHLGLDPRERLLTRGDMQHWWVNLSFASGSTTLALLMPDPPLANWMYGAPGLLYFGVWPVHAWVTARQRRAELALIGAPPATGA